MASSLPLHHPTLCFISNPKLNNIHHGCLRRPSYSFASDTQKRTKPIRATTETPPYSIFQPPQVKESTSELGPKDPAFDKIGYVRSMRAYGIDFKDGFGVYAAKYVEPLRRSSASCFT